MTAPADANPAAAEDADAHESAQTLPREVLAAHTVAQLRALARAQGRTGYSRLAKSQLIDLLS